MGTYLEVSGSIEVNGMMRPFTASVSDCQAGGDEASCTVHAPLLFADDKEIFGIDREHARELALSFLEAMLSGRRLFDLDDKVVSFSELKKRSLTE